MNPLPPDRPWLPHEADIIDYLYARLSSWRAAGRPSPSTYFTAGLERFVAGEIAAERERCAKVAERTDGIQPVTPDGLRLLIAAAIRG